MAKVKRLTKKQQRIVLIGWILTTVIVAAGMAVWLLIRSPDATSVEDTADGTRTFCSQDINLCFKYPSDWSVKDEVSEFDRRTPGNLGGVVVRDADGKEMVALTVVVAGGHGSTGDRCDVITMETRVLDATSIAATDGTKLAKFISQDPDHRWQAYVDLAGKYEAGDSYTTDICDYMKPSWYEFSSKKASFTGLMMPTADRRFNNGMLINGSTAKTVPVATVEAVSKLHDEPMIKGIYLIMTSLSDAYIEE